MDAERCHCCQDFYELTNEVPVLFELGFSNDKLSNSRVQMHSKHRVVHPTTQSPPGYS